ncbi:condensation domain-containing protein [Streptomyces sp. NRRL S-340]|uniref:condensation domain-containing protein n=1 Tax=Streptomyces sp. NRRL S-340 TaxID=1463901 RepID=UPI00131E52B8|nr:condensation domain-containing protein [Streptomyces sp. NRRL S-340]
MRDYEDYMPLAVIQEHFWSSDGSATEQAPLTECVALAVRGPLDAAALRTAVGSLLSRHEILRTAVRLHDGQPGQVVLPVPERLPLTITTLPSPGRETDARQVRDRELSRFAAKGIDPAAGCGIAFLLVRGSDPAGEDILALAVHHIFADATAVRLLLSELAADYDAALAGAPSPVPEPELQYGDFTRWEHASLLPAVQEPDTAWWRDTLRDAPTALDVRPDRPRRRVRRGTGRRVGLVLRGVDGPAVRNTARTLHASPYALCLAGWAAMITRSTGDTDLILGVLAANRTVPQLEPLVGQFANTVPLRLDLGGAPDLAGAVSRCSAAVAAAIEHGRLPFNRIVRAAAVPRPTDRPPLIQHMFMPRVDAVGELSLGGQPVRILDVERDRGRFDTVAEIDVTDDQVRLWLEYDSDLYTPDGIQALVDDYAGVLRQWLARPALRLPELELSAPEPAGLAPVDQEPAEGSEAEELRVDLPGGRSVTFLLDRSRGPGNRPVLTGLRGARAADLELRPGGSVHHPTDLLLAGVPTGLTARRDPRGLLEIVVETPAPVADARPATGTGTGPDRLLALVTEIWAQALEVPGLAPDDDFFTCGGHSLLATALVTEMQETLGVKVRVRALFENPTPAELTAHLRDTEPELDRMLELLAALPDTTPAQSAEAPERHDTHLATARTAGGTAQTVDTPLLSGQRQLWLAQQADPDALTHTIPLILDLAGPLHPEAFAAALNDVVAHQPGLRATFVEVDGLPVQRIRPHTPIDVPVTDLTGHDDAARETELRRLEQEIAYTGFDLTRGPLLRARIIRLGADRAQVQLLFHHLVTDEVSQTLLMQELSTAYRARTAGRAPVLPPHETDLATLAKDERDSLAGAEGERLRRFWVRELTGAAPLRLPTDRPRGDRARFRGEFLERPASADAATTVRELAGVCRTTPFTVFCAAVAIVLGRLSGQSDIVIGIPTANRTQRGADRLIGCFLNVVPVRLDLSGNPRFDELVQRVSEAVLRSYEHQQLPFAEIVQAVQPRRAPGTHPIYQVTCELQLESWMPARFADLDCDYRFVSHGTARYDLAFHGLLRPSGLSAMVELNTDLWDRATGYRRIDQVLELLAVAARGPRTPIDDLPVTEGEPRALRR